MKRDNYYGWVREVAEATTAAKANELLKQGWSLIAIKERLQTAHVGNGEIQNTLIVYILARGEDEGDKRRQRTCGQAP